MSSRVMLGHRTYAMLWWVAGLLLSILAVGVGGQDEALSDPGSGCYCGGDVAASVIITFILTVAACALCYYLRCVYCKRGSRPSDVKKHDVDERAAYDNPHFQSDEPSLDVPDTATVSASSGVGGGSSAANVHNISGSGQEKGMSTLEKLVQAVRLGGSRSSRRAFDDSHLTEPWVVAVPLRGHDFTGLGFNISGNMRDGVFVKDVQHRGPASESGKVSPGDRLLGLAVSTEHMVHEDALTLLSYASPYPVILLLEKYASGADKRLPSSTAGRPIHPFYRSQSIDDLTKIGKADMSRVRKAHLSGARQMKSESSRPDGSESREALKIKEDRAKSRAGNKKVDSKLAKREAPERHSERAIDVPGVETSKSSPTFQIAMPSVSMEKPDSKLKFGIKVLPDLTRRTSKSDLDLEAGGYQIESTSPKISPLEAEINVESEVDKVPKRDSVERTTSDGKNSSATRFGIKLPEFSVRTSEASVGIDKDTAVNTDQNIEDRNISLSTDISGVGLANLGLSGQVEHRKDTHEPKTDDEKQIAMGALGFGFKGFGNDDDSHTTASDEEKAKTKGSIGVNIMSPDINLPFGDAKLNIAQDGTGADETGRESKETEGLVMKFNSPDVTLPFSSEGFEIEGNKKRDGNNPSMNVEIPERKGDTVSSETEVSKHGASFQLPSFDIGVRKGRDQDEAGEDKEGRSAKTKSSNFELPGISLKFQRDKGEKHNSENEQNQQEDLGLDLEGPRISTPDIDLSTDVTLPMGESASEDQQGNKKNKKSKKEFGFGFKTPDFKLPTVSLKSKWDDKGAEDDNADTEKDKKSGKSSGFGVRGYDVDLPDGNAEMNINFGKEKMEFPSNISELEESEGNDKSDNEGSGDERSKKGFKLDLRGPDVTLPSMKLKGDIKEKDDLDDENNEGGKTSKDAPKTGFSFNLKGPDITLPKFGFKRGDGDVEDKKKDYKDDGHDKEFNANLNISSKDKEDDAFDSSEESSDRKSKQGFGISLGSPNISLPSLSLKSRKKSSEEDNADIEDSKDKEGSTESFAFGLKGMDVQLPNVSIKDKGEVKGKEESDEESNQGQAKSDKSSTFGIKNLDINLPNIKFKSRKDGDAKDVEESDDENHKEKSRKEFNINLKDKSLDGEAMLNKDFDYDSGRLEVMMPSVHLKHRDDNNDRSEELSRDESDSEDADGKQDGKNKKKSKEGLKFTLKGPDISLPKLSLKNKKENQKETEHDTGKDYDNEEKSDDESDVKGNSKKGFKLDFRAPKLGFSSSSSKSRKADDHTENQESGAIPKKDYSLDFGKPEVNLNVDSPEDDERYGKEDMKDESKGKSHKGFMLGLHKPEVTLPEMSIRTQKDDEDRESDEDRSKDNAKSRKGFGLPSVILKGPKGSNHGESLNEEDEDSSSTRKGFRFGTKGMEVGLPTINLKGWKKEKDEGSLQDDSYKSKDDSGMGIEYELPEAEVNLPGVSIRSEKHEEVEGKLGDTNNKLSGKLRLESNYSVSKEDENSDEDHENKRTKTNINFGNFKLPTFNLRGHAKGEHQKDGDSDNEDSEKRLQLAAMEKASYNLTLGMDNQEKEQPVKDEDVASDSKWGYKNFLPTLGFNKHDDEDYDNNDDRETKERSLIEVRAPDVNLPQADIEIQGYDGVEKNKGKSKKGFAFGFKAPSINMPSLKSAVGDHAEKEISDEDENLKLQKDEKTYGMNIRYPDIKIPRLGSRKETGLSDDEDAENRKDDKKQLGEKNIHLKSEGLELPSFKLEGGNKDYGERNVDKPEKESRADEKNSKSSFDLDIKLPEFSIPSFGFKGKGDKEELSDSSKRKNKDALEYESQERRGRGENESDEGESEGKSKKGKGFGFDIRAPDVSLPSIQLSTKGHPESEPHDGEDEGSNKKGAAKKSKKGFSFGVKGPDFNLPSLSTKVSAETSKADSEDSGNDSKKIKSKSVMNLELKNPDINKEGIDITLPKTQFSGRGDLRMNVMGPGDFDHSTQYSAKSFELTGTGLQAKEHLDDYSKDLDLDLHPKFENNDEYENMKKRNFDVDVKGLGMTSKLNLKDHKVLDSDRENARLELNLKRDHSNEAESSSAMLLSNVTLPDVNVSLQKPEVSIISQATDVSIEKGVGIGIDPQAFHREGLEIDDVSVVKEIKSHHQSLDYDINSDLPEADLHYKKIGTSLPGMSVELEGKKSKISSQKQPESEQEDSRFSPGFGVAFGFKGFKKHIDIDNVEKDQSNEESNMNVDMVSKEVKIPGALATEGMISTKKKDTVELSLELPREVSGQMFEGSDVHAKKTKISQEGLRMKMKQDGDSEKTVGKGKAEEDDEKSKNKNRFGLGFGFRGFGRSSDSEDDSKEPTSLTPDPDRPDVKEDKKKVRSRMSFGFKGFSKSSDTEEENSERVSGTPMDKDGDEEKPRSKSKSGLHFSFKGRNSRSSDSEDNNDQEKVGTDPHPESGHVKQKLKPNLSFGFKGKSRSYDMEAGEGKGEMRSDSEGIEGEEKTSLDTRGEDLPRTKVQKGRGFAFKSRSGKNTSDSEGGEGEERVELDTHGADEKVKEHKSKGIRLGFKGFKNLKGKIQTEISRMRHDSHSSDDEATREGTVNDHPEAPEGKRKKSSKKKKEKEKKNKKEGAEIIEINEENSHVLTVAAAAAKDNRRKRTEKTNTSSSSSSSSSSEDENDLSTEVKKRKRNRGRSRQVATGVTEVNVKEAYPEDGEVSEKIEVVKREVNIVLPQLDYSVEASKSDDGENTSKRRAPEPPQRESVKTVKTDDVIVKEVKMKHSQPPKNNVEVNEVVQRTVIERQIPMLSLHDVNSTASDSEGERVIIRSDIEPITSSTPKHPPLDSEELKRKAASLGDLSRLHTEPEVVNVILERAMSLDFMRAEATTAVEKVPRLNHPLRLQLPDSSATSIDEEEETSVMALRVDGGTGLRRAGQWGTLEEALQLRKFSSGSLVEAVSPKVYEPEGESISHIEISGSTSMADTSSQWVTASETSKRSITLNKSDDENEDPPALPSTPAPVGGTTITLLDGDATILDGGVEVTPLRRREDVVVVQSGGPVLQEKQVSSFNVQLRQVLHDQEPVHISKITTSSSNSSSRSSLSSDSEAEASILPQESKRRDGVTVTVAPRISSVDVSGTSYSSLPPPVPPKPRSSRAQSPPELVIAHHEPAVVTVRENGAVVVSTDSLTHTENVSILPKSMEHVSIESVNIKPNISETVIVDSSENGNSLPSHLYNMEMTSIPQKSFTQITVDGSGYTVSEGALSRTLIISTPSGPTMPPGPDSPPPILQPPH